MVGFVPKLLADGYSVDEVVREYPESTVIALSEASSPSLVTLRLEQALTQQ
jgi:hypothetical protein